MPKRLVLAVALLHPSAVLAQEDSAEMKLQRCIWACLAGTSGPDSPAYNACVAERCISGDASAGAPAGAPGDIPGGAPAGAPGAQDAARVWQSGRTADGSLYAGIDVAGRAGEAGVYYFCRGGAGRLVIVDPAGVGGLLYLEVGGLLFPLRFTAPSAGRSEAALPPGDPLIGALRRGGRFEVQDLRRRYIYNLSLEGADRALAQVVAGC